MTKQKTKYPCLGQVVFFESIEKSAFRQSLARIALNLAGHEAEYPIDLSEIVRWLPWSECQSALAMASLSASTPFQWRASQEALLIEWSGQVNK